VIVTSDYGFSVQAVFLRFALLPLYSVLHLGWHLDVLHGDPVPLLIGLSVNQDNSSAIL
jgi:hypothetical protein